MLKVKITPNHKRRPFESVEGASHDGSQDRKIYIHTEKTNDTEKTNNININKHVINPTR